MKTKTIMLGAIFAMVCVYGANALTEAECDVTPGMTWENGACMISCGPNEMVLYTGDGQQSCVPEFEIKAGDYVTYKYGEIIKYHDSDVYFGDINWFEEANRVNVGKNITEINGLCARNKTPQANLPGSPYPDEEGPNCWCQIKTDTQISRWVFRSTSSDGASCASKCVLNCAEDLASKNRNNLKDAILKNLENK